MSGLFSKPKTPTPQAPFVMPKTPTVDQSVLDRQQSEAMAKRRGRAATVLAGSSGPVQSGSVATKSLLGQ